MPEGVYTGTIGYAVFQTAYGIEMPISFQVRSDGALIGSVQFPDSAAKPKAGTLAGRIEADKSQRIDATADDGSEDAARLFPIAGALASRDGVRWTGRFHGVSSQVYDEYDLNLTYQAPASMRP